MNGATNFLKKAGTAAGIICLPLAFIDVVGHPAAVIGPSMEPTLHGNDARWWHNDIVWLSKWYSKPKPGDVFTYISPSDPTARHIKRIARCSGEPVKLKSGVKIILAKGEYWMLSDNAEVGHDSRTYGPVNVGLFQAKAKFVLWPPSRFGPIR
uniref:Mitochondrial inner membrane protease subunit 2 n=1 Tax=Panagrellus redivivus TaxID=6233 RepID=A0A7E4ZTP3_PANRE